MSATEELRRMLDERGVGCHLCYVKYGHSVGWTGSNGYLASAEEWGDALLVQAVLTPEEAVDATVGRGDCHTVLMDCFGNPPFNKSGLQGNDVVCGCSECGAPWGTTGLFRGCKLKHNFKACPICGRRVAG